MFHFRFLDSSLTIKNDRVWQKVFLSHHKTFDPCNDSKVLWRRYRQTSNHGARWKTCVFTAFKLRSLAYLDKFAVNIGQLLSEWPFGVLNFPKKKIEGIRLKVRQKIRQKVKKFVNQFVNKFVKKKIRKKIRKKNSPKKSFAIHKYKIPSQIF